MVSGIKTRPVKRMTQAELGGFLEKAADGLLTKPCYKEEELIVRK